MAEEEKDSESSEDPVPATSTAMSVSEPQKGGVEKYSSKGFKWSKKKRKAVRLLMEGKSNKQVARTLSLNEKTIRRWKSTPEFTAEYVMRRREHLEQHTNKDITHAALLKDQMASMAAGQIADIQKSKDAGQRTATQGQLNALQLYLREFRELKTTHRQDHGIDPRGGGSSINVNVGIGMGPEGAPTTPVGSRSFKSFVDEHREKLPERVVARTPLEGLLNIAEELVNNTEMIEDLHKEEQDLADAEAGES